MMEANQEKTDSNLKEIIAETKVWQKEATACQETTEARNKWKPKLIPPR
jgi:hypothetical protein